MKSFAERAEVVQKARRALRKKYGKQRREEGDDVVPQLLKFILMEEAGEAAAEEAMERIRDSFVDLNELRVSFPHEVAEVLPNMPHAEAKSRRATRLLNEVFLERNTLNWDFVRTMGVRELRQYFEAKSRGNLVLGAAAVLLFSSGHAVPADADVRRVLTRLKVVQKGELLEAVHSFLERAVTREQGYEFWALLHRLAEKVCLVKKPACGRCPLKSMCPTGKARATRRKKSVVKKKSKTGSRRKSAKSGTRKRTTKRAGKTAARKRSTKRSTGTRKRTGTGQNRRKKSSAKKKKSTGKKKK